MPRPAGLPIFRLLTLLVLRTAVTLRQKNIAVRSTSLLAACQGPKNKGNTTHGYF
jgi:hypothetical protein